MYKLMVSRNLGESYELEMEAERLVLLKDSWADLDEQGLRWNVEDEDGEMLLWPVCRVYRRLLFPGASDEVIDRALMALPEVIEVLIEAGAILGEENDLLDNQ